MAVVSISDVHCCGTFAQLDGILFLWLGRLYFRYTEDNAYVLGWFYLLSAEGVFDGGDKGGYCEDGGSYFDFVFDCCG
jgi:hypothetical protein